MPSEEVSAEIDWKAQWIYSPLPTTELPPYFRREFSISGQIKKATAYVSATGMYHLRLNGKAINRDFFVYQPSDSANSWRYQTYDLTTHLKSGTNVLAAIVASLPAPENNKQADFFCQLEIYTQNGEKKLILTDQNWQASAGPIRRIDPNTGEIYDSRREIPDWDNIGFDNGTWKRVKIRPQSDLQLSADGDLPIYPSSKLTPRKITAIGEGEYLIDMGKKIIGAFEINAIGTIGDSIRIQLFQKTPRKAESEKPPTIIFVSRGMPKGESWASMWSYSFRYLHISGYPGALKEENIQVWE